MNHDEVNFFEATDEVIEDIKSLDKLYNNEYLTLEEYYNIKKKMIQRMIDIKQYYD